MIMGLFRVVFICAAVGLIFGTAHGSGSSTNVLVKIPGDTAVFNVTRDPATPYTYLTWELSVFIYYVVIVTANETAVTVFPSYEDRVTLLDDGSLELRNLTLNDGRNYRVNITSAEGPEVSTVYQLFVQEPVSDVKFSPETTDLIEDRQTMFKCSARGSDQQFSFYNSTHTFPVLFDYLYFTPSRKNTGPWGCEAYNLVSRAKSQEEFNFTVIYGPDDVTVEAFPSQDEYAEGSYVTLRCTVGDCKPEAEISWSNWDEELPFNGTELKLGPLRYEDSGRYRCMASNRKSDHAVIDSVYIDVEYPPSKQALSDGAIAGIAIACLVVGFGTSALVFYLINRK